MNRREHDAFHALSQTAKMRTLDGIHDHINRERRKPTTVGSRFEYPRPSATECQLSIDTIKASSEAS